MNRTSTALTCLAGAAVVMSITCPPDSLTRGLPPEFNSKVAPPGCGKGSLDSRARSPRYRKTRSGAYKLRRQD